MSDGQKLAAWTAFATIGGGAMNVLFYRLFCLGMNIIIEGDRFEAEPLRSFALGAIICGTCIGGLGLLQMKHRWWAILTFVVGGAMSIGALQ